MSTFWKIAQRHDETASAGDLRLQVSSCGASGDLSQKPNPGPATRALPETASVIEPRSFADPAIGREEATLRERQVEDDLLHLTGLVYGRAIIEQRGAGPADLAWMESAIAKVRARLVHEHRHWPPANSET